MIFMNLDSLTPLKEKLANHRIFERINSIQELKVFMEHHIFAVWDFMSLLKKLQKDLVPSGSPWVPNPNGNLVRFINEIVMEEESDQAYGNGAEISYTSHYQIYLDAMTEVGASTETISRFVEMVKSEGINSAMQKINLPQPSRLFMSHTFKLINEGKSHEIASSFAIGEVSSPISTNFGSVRLEDDQVPVFRCVVRHAELMAITMDQWLINYWKT